MSKKKEPSKRKATAKPNLALVVPFPEERIYRDREIENLIRRLRRAKEDLSEVMVLGLDTQGGFYVTTNGVSKETSLWMAELLKLDVMGLLTEG